MSKAHALDVDVLLVDKRVAVDRYLQLAHGE